MILPPEARIYVKPPYYSIYVFVLRHFSILSELCDNKIYKEHSLMSFTETPPFLPDPLPSVLPLPFLNFFLISVFSFCFIFLRLYPFIQRLSPSYFYSLLVLPHLPKLPFLPSFSSPAAVPSLHTPSFILFSIF